MKTFSFASVFPHLAGPDRTGCSRALGSWRPIPNAPPITIQALANDAIDVAGPVLGQSERLDEPALVENASTKGQEHLLAISRRRTLSEAVTDVLLVRGDRQVVLSTAENPGARFSENGFVKLVERAEGDDRLAECVGSRAEIPLHLFIELLNKASTLYASELASVAKREVQQAVTEATDNIRKRAGRIATIRRWRSWSRAAAGGPPR